MFFLLCFVITFFSFKKFSPLFPLLYLNQENKQQITTFFTFYEQKKRTKLQIMIKRTFVKILSEVLQYPFLPNFSLPSRSTSSFPLTIFSHKQTLLIAVPLFPEKKPQKLSFLFFGIYWYYTNHNNLRLVDFFFAEHFFPIRIVIHNWIINENCLKNQVFFSLNIRVSLNFSMQFYFFW